MNMLVCKQNSAITNKKKQDKTRKALLAMQMLCSTAAAHMMVHALPGSILISLCKQWNLKKKSH